MTTPSILRALARNINLTKSDLLQWIDNPHYANLHLQASILSDALVKTADELEQAETKGEGE